MSPRERKARSSQQESTGGNILFTLGLISVIALLIVGWVMTQGGMDSLSSKADEIKNFATREPTPEPTPLPTREENHAMQQQLDRVIAEYEAKLKKEREAWEKRLEEVTQSYTSQIDSLKLQIVSLEDENERLRKKLEND